MCKVASLKTFFDKLIDINFLYFLQPLTEKNVEASKCGQVNKVPIIKQLNSQNGQRVRK